MRRAAIRLLVLTGCRRNEVLELRWDDIDRTAGELRLRDGKTSARMVPLTPAVAGVLEDIPRVPDNPWVIAGQKPGARMTNVNDPWLVVRAGPGSKMHVSMTCGILGRAVRWRWARA